MPRSLVHHRPQVLDHSTPIQFVKGIGPRRAERLSSAGIQTVGQLLDYVPFRYEDRSRYLPIRSLQEGEWVLTRGKVRSVAAGSRTGRGRRVLEILVADESAGVRVKFFNQAYLGKVLLPGVEIVMYGQVRRDEHGGRGLCLINPECEPVKIESGPSIHTGRIVPVYRKLADLRTRRLRQILFDLISRLPSDMEDPLPFYLRRKLNLMSKRDAIAAVHFPVVSKTKLEQRAEKLDSLNGGRSPAHKRMIFDELFQHQVRIAMMREARSGVEKAFKILIDQSVRDTVKKVLPFHPSEAQKRVLGEIVHDMCARQPMNRLLQGDVGSGKTIVAAQAAIIAVENGYQAALMAPTEILAEQHFYNFRRLTDPISCRVGLLKGSQSSQEKRKTLSRIRSGEVQIVIGTHALIQESVVFRNLALVVVDEQHRFGVSQRSVLTEKGAEPDFLVMTATPIPRTLAMTCYGDLEVSVIDQLPPGRRPPQTKWLRSRERDIAYQEVRRFVSEGQQAYIVLPLVEESEKSDLKAAVEMAAYLREKVFPDLSVGLIHGRMPAVEKEETMRAFVDGSTNVLVATTVIEVGVDVANASIMIIEHAERFGLAQLHQLRGRVGRGSFAARCFLIADAAKGDAERRLKALCETSDGFRIAEMDLQIRGPGEVLGTRQSGVPLFRFADLIRDRKAIELARAEAKAFVNRLKTGKEGEVRRAADLIRGLDVCGSRSLVG